VLQYTETPLQEIHDAALDKAGIQLIIKREDLNHPYVSGNKWWKLKYNLEEAARLNLPILTFGGAYSNHIFATAAAGKELGTNTIGIIRGERTEDLNKTLTFAESQGMHLHFISREQFRNKAQPSFIQSLNESFGDFYLIPEGGTNSNAVKGCKEFAISKLSSVDFDALILPVGTGGTIAGLVSGLPREREIIGVSVLKNGEFLVDDIAELLQNYSAGTYGNWSIATSYDHGGYAKATKELLDLLRAMKMQHNLPLDSVYTGKLMWAVLKEAERGRFSRGSTVLALHTGGLQGQYY
jgi:1-aminocyclopropane-1-carboxylate deaminase